MQKHWDVMRSDDDGRSWYEISGDLPTDFGFAIDVHAHDPTPSTWCRSPATSSTIRRTGGCACTGPPPEAASGSR
jgi:hypothetical protein